MCAPERGEGQFGTGVRSRTSSLVSSASSHKRHDARQSPPPRALSPFQLRHLAQARRRAAPLGAWQPRPSRAAVERLPAAARPRLLWPHGHVAALKIYEHLGQKETRAATSRRTLSLKCRSPASSPPPPLHPRLVFERTLEAVVFTAPSSPVGSRRARR